MTVSMLTLTTIYQASYLLPSMHDGLICSQSRQSQCPDFGAGTHLLPLLSFLWKLYIVLQSQTLSDQMVIDQVVDTPRK
jgi:hypothetical protein